MLPPGKKVADHLDLHISSLGTLDEAVLQCVHSAVRLAGIEAGEGYNVVKIDRGGETVSLLSYPEFFDGHSHCRCSSLNAISQMSWRASVKTVLLTVPDEIFRQGPDFAVLRSDEVAAFQHTEQAGSIGGFREIPRKQNGE